MAQEQKPFSEVCWGGRLGPEGSTPGHLRGPGQYLSPSCARGARVTEVTSRRCACTCLAPGPHRPWRVLLNQQEELRQGGRGQAPVCLGLSVLSVRARRDGVTEGTAEVSGEREATRLPWGTLPCPLGTWVRQHRVKAAPTTSQQGVLLLLGP